MYLHVIWIRFFQFAKIINDTVEELDPSIKIISEPGRFYVESAFTAAAAVIGKKPYLENNEKKFKYYINDGCYGSFVEELLQLRARLPVIINRVSFTHFCQTLKKLFLQLKISWIHVPYVQK